MLSGSYKRREKIKKEKIDAQRGILSNTFARGSSSEIKLQQGQPSMQSRNLLPSKFNFSMDKVVFQ